MQPDTLTQAFEAIVQGGDSYGFLGAFSALLTVGVGVFKFFAPDYWARQKRWVKLSWVFGTATGGALVLALVTGVAIPAALFGSTLAGFAAIGMHQSKKATMEGVKESLIEQQIKAMQQLSEISRKAPDLKVPICSQQSSADDKAEKQS